MTFLKEFEKNVEVVVEGLEKLVEIIEHQFIVEDVNTKEIKGITLKTSLLKGLKENAASDVSVNLYLTSCLWKRAFSEILMWLTRYMPQFKSKIEKQYSDIIKQVNAILLVRQDLQESGLLDLQNKIGKLADDLRYCAKMAKEELKPAGKGPGASDKVGDKKKRKKTPPQLLKETRERQAAKELAKNPNITAEKLGKILDCDKSTIVRLEALSEKIQQYLKGEGVPDKPMTLSNMKGRLQLTDNGLEAVPDLDYEVAYKKAIDEALEIKRECYGLEKLPALELEPVNGLKYLLEWCADSIGKITAETENKQPSGEAGDKKPAGMEQEQLPKKKSWSKEIIGLVFKKTSHLVFKIIVGVIVTVIGAFVLYILVEIGLFERIKNLLTTK